MKIPAAKMEISAMDRKIPVGGSSPFKTPKIYKKTESPAAKT
jgi:hypothetical protein